MAEPTRALITIVILNWNGKHWLETFLPSVIAAAGPQQELLVVDNGSTDDSVSYLATAFPDVSVLELSENYGFAEGNNKAMPHVKTPFFVLLNSDVEVREGWTEPLIERLLTEPDLALLQPKVLSWHERTSFEYAGASGGWLDRWGYAFCRGRIFDLLEQDVGQYDEYQDCFWATGACLAGRTELVHKHGLFHGELFAHWEEIDLCWRMKNLGYRVAAEPASVVFHVGGGTLPKGNPRKTYLNVRNSLICLYVNLPARLRFRRIFSRLLLDGIWATQALISGEFSSVRAIFRGHWAFFRAISFWDLRRQQIYKNQLPQAIPEAGYWPGSVVWYRFVKGKKTFFEIVPS